MEEFIPIEDPPIPFHGIYDVAEGIKGVVLKRPKAKGTPDKSIFILKTCRDEIFHDFKG